MAGENTNFLKAFKADSLEELTDAEIVKIFNYTRNRDYQEILKELQVNLNQVGNDMLKQLFLCSQVWLQS